MPEPLGGLTKGAAATLGQVVTRVLGRLPDVGRRTRRVYSGGGGGGNLIVFQLSSDPEDIDCDNRTAIGTVVSRSLGASSPECGATIMLCDLNGCFLVGNSLLLAGSTGWATQMECGNICTPLAYAYVYDLDVWCIFSMCPPDMSC